MEGLWSVIEQGDETATNILRSRELFHHALDGYSSWTRSWADPKQDLKRKDGGARELLQPLELHR